MKEQQYIKICIELIENKLEWGPSSKWTNYNYNKLSSYIIEKSNISLSARTLRRIISDDRKFKPQAATRNALAIYLGYKDWEHFKISLYQGDKSDSKAVINGLTKGKSKFSILLANPWLYIVLPIILVIVLSIIFYPGILLKLNAMRVEFTSTYTPGNAPQRVTFYYDVSRVNSSNIFINKNFYDDGEIIPLNKNRHFFTTDFALPDHYSVKIIANGERLSCIRIHVLTNGWEGILNGRYIGPVAMDDSTGYLHLPDSVLRQQADSNLMNYDLQYRNIREFNTLGDALTLETEIRLPSEDSFDGCQSTTVQLMNLHGRIGFTFVKPGCDVSLLKAEFGDVMLNGEFQKLDAFYQELDHWRKVKIKTEKKTIYVYLDEELIYSVKYKDPLDTLKGLAFKFQGPGEVNYVRILDHSNKLIYEENF
jgi:hypothetical protein